MQRGQFTFYRSYFEAIKALPKKEQYSVLMAVCAYALDNEEPKIDGTAGAIFALIKPTLDTGRRKAEGGLRSTKKKDRREEDARCAEDEDKISARCAEDNGNEKEKEKEIEIEIEKEKEDECPPPIPPSRGAAQKRFTPPTVPEIESYCRERQNDVDPQRFHDFYAAKGWKVGNQPMKDWRAAIRTWERRDERGKAGKPAERRTPTDDEYSYIPDQWR